MFRISGLFKTVWNCSDLLRSGFGETGDSCAQRRQLNCSVLRAPGACKTGAMKLALISVGICKWLKFYVLLGGPCPQTLVIGCVLRKTAIHAPTRLMVSNQLSSAGLGMLESYANCGVSHRDVRGLAISPNMHVNRKLSC